MSKTVHPYSFRLGILRNWRSRWFNPVKYRHLLKADVLVREELEKSMRGMYVEGIEIETKKKESEIASAQAAKAAPAEKK